MPWDLYLLNAVAGVLLPLCVVLEECLFAVLLKYRIRLLNPVFSLACPAFFAALLSLIPSAPARFISQGVVMIVLMSLYVSQFVYYRIFQTLYVTQSLQGAGKAMQFIGVAVTKIRQNLFAVFLLIAPAILYFAVGFPLMSGATMTSVTVVSAASLLVFSSILWLLAFVDTRGVLSPNFLLSRVFMPDPTLRRYGLLTTMAIDLKLNVLGWVDKRELPINLARIKVVEGSLSAQESAKRTSQDPAPGISQESVQESAKNSARSSARSSAKKSVKHSDLGAVGSLEAENDFEWRGMRFREGALGTFAHEPWKSNAYTGRFAGKNLILITAESFSKYLIDPVRTPTLYKMATEGFHFENFYTPLWGVSTSDGEYVAMTGLLPKSGVWSYTNVIGHEMPMALGNQFRASGYGTYAYHNNTYTYYNRDRSYPTMGYSYKGLGSGLEVRPTWPESDREMIDLSTADFLGSDQPFHVYYLTVSGHMEYSFAGNYIANKNRARVEGLAYSESVRAYIACCLELEDALTLLLERLRAAGQAENTVIALSADHYPYGLSEKAYAELAGRPLDGTFEKYRNAFLLWHEGIEPVHIKTACSSLDILPTLSNLFGLPYEPRLLAGTDILSDEPPTVILADRSFINDRIRFDAEHERVSILDHGEVSREYVGKCIQDVARKFLSSEMILDKDGYRKTP